MTGDDFISTCDVCGKPVYEGWDIADEGFKHLTCLIEKSNGICSGCGEWFFFDGDWDFVCEHCRSKPRRLGKKEKREIIEKAKRGGV